MSDIPLGPGWWQASDGKWYHPDQHPSAVAGRTTTTVPPSASSETPAVGAGASSPYTAEPASPYLAPEPTPATVAQQPLTAQQSLTKTPTAAIDKGWWVTSATIAAVGLFIVGLSWAVSAVASFQTTPSEWYARIFAVAAAVGWIVVGFAAAVLARDAAATRGSPGRR
jgi:hypothetical protein